MTRVLVRTVNIDCREAESLFLGAQPDVATQEPALRQGQKDRDGFCTVRPALLVDRERFGFFI